MSLKKYRISEHFEELKRRTTLVLVWFVLSCILTYSYSQEIFQFLLRPLIEIAGSEERRMIYTGLTEAFFTYLSLSVFTGFLLSIPIIIVQIYLFIRPGLYEAERRTAFLILFASPLLFITGGFFVFYLVIPQAWHFFMSFEMSDASIPLLLEARISEYLALVIKLILAFGLAFQMPVILVILGLLGFVSASSLKKKRRIAILLNFIIAGIFTPPDILSQISLAIPMLLLYEFSILILTKIAHK